jgi:hypothetical protein
VPYFSKRIVAPNIRLGRAIMGIWRILDGKDESGLFSCLEL